MVFAARPRRNHMFGIGPYERLLSGIMGAGIVMAA